MSFRRHNNARRFGGLFLELEDEPLKVSRSSDPCRRTTRLALMECRGRYSIRDAVSEPRRAEAAG